MGASNLKQSLTSLHSEVEATSRMGNEVYDWQQKRG